MVCPLTVNANKSRSPSQSISIATAPVTGPLFVPETALVPIVVLPISVNKLVVVKLTTPAAVVLVYKLIGPVLSALATPPLFPIPGNSITSIFPSWFQSNAIEAPPATLSLNTYFPAAVGLPIPSPFGSLKINLPAPSLK